MTRGVLMMAHNNAEIDYFKIACANALMVKHNLGVPVTLVTDAGSESWGRKSMGDKFVNGCFDNIIVLSKQTKFDNQRVFSDTASTQRSLQFYNCNHWAAYELSPYDETLFIDADYLIMSSSLANCWESSHDFMINSRIFTPGASNNPSSRYIDDFGIKMFWATVIYFKKTDFSKFVFDTVKHVQDNYHYYTQLYSLTSGMFRNDHAFSIAMHMLGGFISGSSLFKELPITALFMSWDTQDIQHVNGINDITLFTEKETKGEYRLCRLADQDVHIMNKWAISRNADRLVELYSKATA